MHKLLSIYAVASLSIGGIATAQDSHIQGDLAVDGVARIDGGTDLVGEGLAVYADEATYQSGGAPSLEITASGSIKMPEPSGDISMGAFTGVLNLEQLQMSSYRTSGSEQDGAGGNSSLATFADDGKEIKIGVNSWKKLAYEYMVTSQTVLTFEFKSDDDAEIFGIGLDTDGNIDNGQIACFALGGSQDVSSLFYWNVDYKNYIVGTHGWKRYSIPVGQYFTGQRTYLTLICDEDRTGQTAEARFRNISISN